MAGEVASLLLSRMTVPVLFYLSERKKHERPTIEGTDILAEAFIEVTDAGETNGHPTTTAIGFTNDAEVTIGQSVSAKEIADSSQTET